MSPIPCIGLGELFILAGVTGLACGVLLSLGVVITALVLGQRQPLPSE
jgi:hypothetical protein